MALYIWLYLENDFTAVRKQRLARTEQFQGRCFGHFRDHFLCRIRLWTAGAKQIAVSLENGSVAPANCRERSDAFENYFLLPSESNVWQ